MTHICSTLVLVGADPQKIGSQHPGGVQTLSAGILDQAVKRGHEVQVIDTTRSGFDSTGLWARVRAGLGRLGDLRRQVRAPGTAGAIIIAGAGFSFIERCAMAALARAYRVPSVLLIVDGWYMEAVKSSVKWRWISRLFLRAPNKIAAMGAPWLDMYASLGVPRDRLVDMNFFLPSSFTPKQTPAKVAPDAPVRFVFLGWLVAEKGVNELMQAAEWLQSSHRFELVFLGGGTLLDEVRAWITASGRGDLYQAPGWVQGADLRAQLDQAHVFVLPSYAEGFPMSLIEAFSSGLPAIASDVGGISGALVSGQNGQLIAPRDTDSLARALEVYLKDPFQVEAQGQRALETARTNHDRDRNTAILLDALGPTPHAKQT